MMLFVVNKPFLVLEDVFWSGAYEHIIFVNSKTSFSGKKNSFISEYHILAKPINADILSWQMLSARFSSLVL